MQSRGVQVHFQLLAVCKLVFKVLDEAPVPHLSLQANKVKIE